MKCLLKLGCGLGLSVLMAGQALADTGIFVGAGGGQANLQDYSCGGCGSPIGSLDDSDTAITAFGGYRFNSYFAALAGYADLGETTASGEADDWQDKLEADAMYVALRGIIPLSPSFELHATAGMAWWDQSVTFTGIPTGDFDGNDMMYGAGATFRFGGKKAMGVQLDFTNFVDVGTDDPLLGHKNDINMLTLNFIYQIVR
jgi:hypothetical protein